MTEQSPALDPTDLLIFARVVEAGGLGRAAERLGLPKSTVSRRLAAMESRLGERLMLRTTRRQTLTDFGQLMLEHARQVAAEVDAAQTLAEQRHGVPSGRLRVSMPSDLANLVLTDAIADFVAQHPALTLELDLSARQVDLIGEGFDLAVRASKALPDDATLAARPLGRSPFGVFASPGYLAAHGEPRHPDDLRAHRSVHLVASDGEPMPWRLQRGDAAWEGMPPSRIGANSLELLLRLALRDLGLVMLPAYFARCPMGEGVLRPVLADWWPPARPVWAVFPGRKLMPMKTRAFIEMLQQSFAPLEG